MTSSVERTASSHISSTMKAARSQYRLEDMEIKNALGKRNSIRRAYISGRSNYQGGVWDFNSLA